MIELALVIIAICGIVLAGFKIRDEVQKNAYSELMQFAEKYQIYIRANETYQAYLERVEAKYKLFRRTYKEKGRSERTS